MRFISYQAMGPTISLQSNGLRSTAIHVPHTRRAILDTCHSFHWSDKLDRFVSQPIQRSRPDFRSVRNPARFPFRLGNALPFRPELF